VLNDIDNVTMCSSYLEGQRIVLGIIKRQFRYNRADRQTDTMQSH